MAKRKPKYEFEVYRLPLSPVLSGRNKGRAMDADKKIVDPWALVNSINDYYYFMKKMSDMLDSKAIVTRFFPFINRPPLKRDGGI